MTNKPFSVNVITLDLGPRRNKQYLSDGVYAEHDDIQIWLSTERFGVVHEIAIDDETYHALVTYRQKMMKGGK